MGAGGCPSLTFILNASRNSLPVVTIKHVSGHCQLFLAREGRCSFLLRTNVIDEFSVVLTKTNSFLCSLIYYFLLSPISFIFPLIFVSIQMCLFLPFFLKKEINNSLYLTSLYFRMFCSAMKLKKIEKTLTTMY